MNEVESTQLEVIVAESGLDKTKSQVLLEKFNNFFEVAAEWEAKVDAITITDVSQKEEMKMADDARKFLKQKRVDVEHTRKILKEESLREGQVIDRIAKDLKNLIEPIELKAETLAKFAEIKEREEKQRVFDIRTGILSHYNTAYDSKILYEMNHEMFDSYLIGIMRADEEKKEAIIAAEIEEARLQKEEAERQEAIRVENEKLRAEAVEKEKALAIERAEAAAKLKAIEDAREAERKTTEAKIQAEREQQAKIVAEQAANLKKERDALAKIEAELSDKKEAEQKAEEQRLAAIEADLSMGDKAKFDALITDIEAIQTKYSFKSKKYKTLQANVNELLNKTINYSISKL